MQDQFVDNNFQEDQFDIDYLEKRVDSFDWRQIDERINTVPENKYYQVEISDKATEKYYLRFRYILQHQNTHFLPITFALCTFLIKSSTNNYYALMLRKKIVNHEIKQLNNDEKDKRALLQRELKFMNNLLQDNPKQYHVWTYKKDLISSMVQNQQLKSQQHNTLIKNQIYSSENKFIFSLLIQDCRNYHAWDYRFWLVSYLRKIEQQLEWIDGLITHDSGMSPLKAEQRQVKLGQLSITQVKINWMQVNSLWSHRFNLIRYMGQNYVKTATTNALFLVEEIKSTIMLLQINRKNQPLWNYLSGLLNIIEQQQKQQSSSLLSNEIQHNLNLIFDPTQIQLLEVQHMNRFELSFLKKHITYFNLTNQDQIKLIDKVLNQLKTIDQTREKYYDYLIMTKGKC